MLSAAWICVTGAHPAFFGSLFPGEWKLVQPHVDAPAAEGDAFAFEAQPLFHPRMRAELDFAAGTDHAMPRDGAVGGA